MKMELLRLITPAIGTLALTVLGFIYTDIRDIRADVAGIRETHARVIGDVRERLARLEARP